MGAGGAGNGKHTHTHIVPRDTHCEWRLGQGLDAIRTDAGVVRTLIKLMGYEHREDALGLGEQEMAHTHTHKHGVPRDAQGG